MNANLFNTTRIMLAVIAAAGVGIALYFDTNLHELITLGASIAAFFVILLIIPRRKEAGELFIAPGVTLADKQATLEQGKTQIDALKEALRKIPKTDPAYETIGSIEDIFSSIYDNLESDPGDIPTGRAFLSFHSPEAVGLVENYARLVSNRLPGNRQLEQIEAARIRFASIEKAFHAQYNAMKDNDVRALEQASRNLESSLRIEHGLENMTVSKPKSAPKDAPEDMAGPQEQTNPLESR